MNQVVKIFTNHVEGGWSPFDLEDMLGGSEECVVLLSEAFARKKYEVIVYHTKYGHEKGLIARNGVNYQDRIDATCYSDDIFITFKDHNPWIQGAKAKKNIHWSSDVEKPWDTTKVDYFVNLTEYHQNRNLFVDADRSIIVPHGIDIHSFKKIKTIPNRNPNSMLYCSSPDRGLEQLLFDWPKIIEHFPNMELRITYGFDLYDRITQSRGRSFQDFISNRITEFDSIKMLGTLSKSDMLIEYLRSEFWVLPLNNPDSELFCLNALKARHCCMDIITNKIGALKNTVGSYIAYQDFLIGKMNVKVENADVDIMNWDEVVEKYWAPLFED